MKNKGIIFPIALVVAIIISSSSMTLAASSPLDDLGIKIPADLGITIPADLGTAIPSDVSRTAIPVDGSSTATPTGVLITATPADASSTATPTDVLVTAIPTTGSGTAIPTTGSGTAIPTAGSGTAIPTADTSGYGIAGPTAAFTVTQKTWAAPYSMSFTDKSTGTVFMHNWDFGDGSTSSEQSPVHSYAAAGKYNVTLQVFGMGSNAVTKVITVAASKPSTGTSSTGKCSTGKAPVAAFTSCVSGKTVKFTDKSTGSPNSYVWDFGDKCTSTSKSPSHKYAKAGKYKVTLTAKNSAGSNKKSNTVTVK